MQYNHKEERKARWIALGQVLALMLCVVLILNEATAPQVLAMAALGVALKVLYNGHRKAK